MPLRICVRAHTYVYKDPDPILAGNDLTYTIVVTNNGPSDATNVQLTDTLPAGVTFSSANATAGTCNEAAGTVTCDIGILANGASATSTIVVAVPSSAADTATIAANSASVSADETDPTPGNDTNDSGTSDVDREADLGLTKTKDPDPVLAGNDLTYTIVITNNGPSDATNVQVTDTLPAGVTFGSANTTAGTCGEAAGTVTCDIGNLADGAIATSTIVVNVPASTADSGTIAANSASVTATETDPTPGNDTNDSGTSDVDREADLGVTKTRDADPVLAGNNLTYTVTVTNNGPSDASNVQISDPLPAGVTFSSANATAGTCGEAAGTVTCDIGILANGAIATSTIVVTVPSNTSDSATIAANSASVSADETDPTAGNDSNSSGTSDVDREVDLSLSKTRSAAIVAAGGSLTYTIEVTNNGPSDASGVSITDNLPTEVTLNSSTGCTESPAGGEPTCTIGDIAAGATATVTFDVTVGAGVSNGTTVSNTASLNNVAETETNNGNDSGSVDFTVNLQADLTITKVDAGQDPAIAGGNVAYTITVTNGGPSDATGVSVVDTLPAGMTYASSNPDICNAVGQTVTCDIGNISNGANASFTLTATIASSVAHNTPLTNSATVSSDQADPSTGDEDVTEQTTINREADLAISKTRTPAVVIAGEDITYTIVVTNNGLSDASSVQVTDPLPGGVTFGSANSTVGTCSEAAGTVTCDVGDLVNGASATITIVAGVPSDTADTAVIAANTATVTATETDPTPGDNDNSGGTSDVDREVDLTVSKTADLAVVGVGATVTYTIAVTNNGSSDASGVTVTDNLPAEVASFTTAGCAEDPAGAPTCSLGDIAPGATVSYTIVAVIDGSTSEGTDVTNTASIGAVNETETNDTDDSDSVTVNVNSSADIQVTITDDADPAVAGDDVTYTIDVDNNGADGATNPTVTITLPPGTTFVSSNPPAGGSCDPPAGGQVTCTLPDIANGGSEQVTITINIPSDAADGSSFDVTVTGDSDAGDPIPANNSAITENTTVAREFDLVVTKTADPATLESGDIVAGRVVTYKVAVTNNGSSDASSVVVTDTLPISAGGTTFTFVNATTTAGTCPARESVAIGNPVTCNIGDIAAGDTVNISIAAKLSSSGIAGDTLTNSVSATFDASETDTAPGNNTNIQETQNVVRIVNIRIIQEFNPEPPEAGEDLTVTTRVVNGGPSDATDVSFKVEVPNDPLVTLTSTSSTLPTTCNMFQRPGSIPERVECSIGDLAAGDADEVDMQLVVTDDENTPPGTPLPFPPTVTTTPPGQPPTFIPPGDPNVVRVVDLVVGVQSAPSPAVAGTELTYTVEVTNNGPVFPATNVQSTLQLPAGTTFVPSGGGATAVSLRSFRFLATSADCTAVGQLVTCNFGTVALGDTESLDVTVTVSPSIPDGANLDAQASVSATENEGDPSNNTAPEQTPSDRQSDVVAVNISAPTTATQGETFNVNLNIQNSGPSDAANAKVTYKLPPGVEFVGSVPPGLCVQVGNNIECDLSSLGNASGDIPAGSQVGFSIILRAIQTGTIDHEVNADSASADPDPTNNDLADQTQASGQAPPPPTNTPGPTATPVPQLPAPQVTECSPNIEAPPGVVLWCRQVQFFDQDGGQVASVLPGQQKDFSYTLSTANLDLMGGRPGALNEHALGRVNYRRRSPSNPNLWFSISSLYSVGPPAVLMTTRFSGTHILLWSPQGTAVETATPTPVPDQATATPVPTATPRPEPTPTPDLRTPITRPTDGGFPPPDFVRPSDPRKIGAGVGLCDPDDPNRSFPRSGEVLRCIVVTITDGSGTPIGDAPPGESVDLISGLTPDEIEKMGGIDDVFGTFLAKDLIYQRLEPETRPSLWFDRQSVYSAAPSSMLTNTTQSGTYILFLRSAPALPVTGDTALGNSLLWMFALLGAAMVATGVFLPRFRRREGTQA